MSEETPGTSAGGTEDDVQVGQDELDVLETDDEEETETDEETEETEEETEETIDEDDETVSEDDDDEDLEEEEEDEDLDDDDDEEDEDEDSDDDDKDDVQESWKSLKERLPEAAKDREFKSIFFRHHKFNLIFPGGISQAEEAEQKATAMDFLDTSLADGDPTEALKNMNEESAEKLAEKFLPALFKFNKEHYAKATKPLIVDVLNSALEYAEKTSDKNLRISVRNLSNFLTGSKDVPKRVAKVEEDPRVETERKKLQQERLELLQGEQQKFLVGVDNKISDRITKLSNSALTELMNVDTDEDHKLSSFAQSAITERAIRDIKQRLNNDRALMARLQNLKQQAVKSKFDSVFERKISSAYLQAAKRLLPRYMKKHRNEALGITTAKGKIKDKKKVVASGKKKVKTDGGVKPSKGRKIDTNKTSEEDYLSGKVVFK